jgi:hypothetical protein
MKNTSLNTTFNIYLLYSTDRDDEGNFYRLLRNYSNIGIELQAYLIDWEKMDGLPKSYLYIPADHELFIQRAYKDGLLTKEQINLVNCKIIEECNLLINFGNGIKMTGDDGSVIEGYIYSKELEYAQQEKIPIYSMPDLSPMAIQSLRLAIKLIVKAGG